MDRIIAAALVALALPGSAHAESNEIEAAPLALETEGELLRSLVFEVSAGPHRTAVDLARFVTVSSTPAEVFDWVSPVFVWLEPGYAYAETSICFE